MSSKAGRGKVPSAVQYTTIALDLDNAEQALELARKMVERSGQSVTVCDAEGEIVAVVKGANRH